MLEGRSGEEYSEATGNQPAARFAFHWMVILATVVAALLVPLLAAAYLSTGPTGQKSWYWQNPVPQGNDLNSTSFGSEMVGWAVGRSGTVVKTVNGGTVWEYQDASTTKDLNGVSFVDEARGWVAGAGGTIRRTSDGGATWLQQQLPGLAATELRSISFLDLNRGVAAGANAVIYYTTDGGVTWRTATDPVTNTSINFTSATWSSAVSAYVVGDNGTILKSTDGGATWTQQSSGVSVGLNSVSFAKGSTVGFAVGNVQSASRRTVLKTTNGGATWTTLPSSIKSVNLYAVDCIDANNVTIAGAGGSVWTTSDGGSTWTSRPQPLAGTTALHAVEMIGSAGIRLVGDFGTILTSEDAGASWASQTSGSAANLTSVWLADAENGWAVGSAGTVLRTSDGGTSWSGQTIAAGVLRSAWFAADGTTGWAVGDAGQVRRTTDSGATWTPQTSGVTAQLNAAWFADANTGWAVGANGTVIKTLNGGLSWTRQDPGTGADLNAVWFADASTGWAAGAKGTLLKTTNGGATWIAQAVPTNASINGIRGVSGTSVWAVGDSGLLLRTTNGTSWASLASGTSRDLYSVFFSSASDGWLAGAYGTVRSTTDGGSSWTAADVGLPTGGTNVAVRSIAFSGTKGLCAGDGGAIRVTDDGGTQWASAQTGTVQWLHAIAFADAYQGWVTGDAGALLHTQDGGQNWFNEKSGTTANLYGISMATASAGWAVGASGTVRRTTDGGRTWTAQTSGTTQQLACVASGDASHAVAAGLAGVVRYTSNGGATWLTPSVPPTTQNINTACMTSASTGFIGANYSSSGVVFRTTDGGATWKAMSVAVTGHDITALDFSGAQGWAVTSNGAVLKSSDGGASWVVSASGADWGYAPLNDIHFTGASRGYAVGEAGLVLKTSDGGVTWRRESSGTTYHSISAIEFVDAQHGWIVGSGGLIMRTTESAPPETALAVSPSAPDGRNGWYITRPAISFVVTGTATTWFSWDFSAAEFAPVQGSVDAPDGVRTLSYYSVGSGGACEATKTATFKVDTVAPSAPAVVSAEGVSTSEIVVRWSEALDTGSGIAGYDVSADDVVVASTPLTSTVVSGLAPNTAPHFSVTAIDAAGNASAPSVTATAATFPLDRSPLRTTASFAPLLPDGANDWYVTTPTVSFAVAPSVPATTSYSWTSPSGPWSTYSSPVSPAASGLSFLYFRSVDASLARDPEITQSLAIKFDPGRPAAPAGLDVSPLLVGSTSATLQWSPVSGTASGIDRYEVFENGLYLGSTAATSFELVGLAPKTSYRMAVRAVSGAGTASDFSAPLDFTTLPAPSLAPPAYVVARAVSGEVVFVNWEPAQDATGTVTYTVWRSMNAAYFEPIGTVSGRYNCTFVDRGARSSTAYTYAVSAVDDRGEGAPSLSVTAPDYTRATTAGPSRPTGLRAVEGSGTVALSWLPNPEPDLQDYVVLRAERSMGAYTTMTPEPVAGTLFVDSSVANRDAYYYRVRAVDAAGTLGQPSIELRAQPRGAVPVVRSPHVPDPTGKIKTCEKCHGLHDTIFSATFRSTEASSTSNGAASLEAMLTRAGRNEALCLSCHDGVRGSDIKSNVEQSVVPAGGRTSAGTIGRMTCTACHAPHEDPASSQPAMLASPAEGSGNTLCYGCHGAKGGSAFGGLDGFELSAHAALQETSSTAGITCLLCHESHGSATLHSTRYTGAMQCLQCHSGQRGDADVADIWNRLTMSEDPTSHLPLLPSDQADGARMACENCHNAHVVSQRFPLVDPRNPGPAGEWTGPRSEQSEFCFRCHGPAGLPTSAETSGWVEPPLATGGTTTLPDLETAWQTNVHGDAAAGVGAAAHLRDDMGYQAGDSLECETCHEPHGTANAFALRQDIVSADGTKRIDGVLVYKIAEGGYDLRFFCNTCHVVDAATHTAAPIDSFPTNCMASGCHRHISAESGGTVAF